MSSKLTDHELLTEYSELIKQYFNNTVTVREFAASLSALEKDENEADFLRLPYIKRRFGLNRTEYLAVITAAVLETEGSLPVIGIPCFAHIIELASKMYPLEYETMEILMNDKLFSLLWEEREYVRPLILKPLALRREALFFILCGQIEQSPNLKIYFPGKERYAPISADLLKKLQRDLLNGITPLLSGARGCGKRTLVRMLAQTLNIPVIFVSPCNPDNSDNSHNAENAVLAAIISGAFICSDDNSETFSFWKKHAPYIITSEDEVTVKNCKDIHIYKIPKLPDGKDRPALWEFLAEKHGFGKVPFSDKYRFTTGETAEIFSAAENAEELERLLSEKLFSDPLRAGLLKKSGFSASAEDFHGDAVKNQLELICLYAKHRDGIFKKYGVENGSYGGRGVSALFYGPSGTGKTMASHIIADSLGLPLMKVSLSDVFDKYVGETEKNISEIFEAAETCAAVILFDEADSLFSRRANMSEPRGRYDNLPTSLLLQKTEEYDGIVILTTNLLKNLDGAFLRRIKFVVRFPGLDEQGRERYWREMLGDNVNAAALAKREISPARIKEIVKTAALLAFQGGKNSIGEEEVAYAMKAEFEKSGFTAERRQ